MAIDKFICYIKTLCGVCQQHENDEAEGNVHQLCNITTICATTKYGWETSL